MKKISLIFLLVITTGLARGQTASELFTQLPESFSLPLSTSDRLDLIDLYKAGKKAEVKNPFEDSCVILRLTDDYLQIQMGVSTIELFVLSMINDSKIVGFIQTVCAPVCDSYLEFYTTTWKKLNAKAFISVADKHDYLKKGINPEEDIIKNALIPLDISLMSFHYEPDKQVLEQYYNTPAYLGEDDRAKVKPYLIESPLLFHWNLTRFE